MSRKKKRRRRKVTKEKPGRAPHRLNREAFSNILNLHVNQPWTVSKQPQLYDLLDECENLEEQTLVLNLLNAYENFDERRASEAFFSISNQIMNIWNLDANNTLVVAVHNENDVGSAPALLQSVKPCFKPEWRGALVSHMKPALDKLQDGMNVVFIDDFVGTGGQFCKALEWFFDQLETRSLSLSTIHLVSLCIMKQAIPLIEEKEVIHFAAHYMEKGITGKMGMEQAERAKNLMLELEGRLKWKDKKQRERYSMGFMQSEALFRYMDNNAPNNNFPIFWWRETSDGYERSTIQVRF